MPKVSVVMAVHNGEPYLKQAVESILEQGFRDFEFLIIDDASTDGGRELLSGLSDQRLRVIANSTQLGLSGSLNKGIEVADGEYIARMDHDDISLLERLQKQVDFLDAHGDIDVLGTWAQTLGRTPKQTWRYPTLDEDIRSEFVFSSSLVHSSVMLRKATFARLQLGYEASIPRAQDYELWTRIAPQVRFANLDSVQLLYRVHQDQAGNKYGAEQQAAAEEVRSREIGRLGVKPSRDEVALHNRISRWEQPSSRAELEILEHWFLKLRAGNQTNQAFPVEAFGRALERRWWAACKANIRLGLEAWRIYTSSRLRDSGKRSFPDKAQFWAKAALRQLGWKL